MSDGGVTPQADWERLRSDVSRMAEGAGVARGAHGLIWVRGADAVTFLDGLVSQSVADVDPGGVRRSLLLTPNGKMRAFLWLLGGADDEVGLITQATTIDTVVSDLTRFRFRVDAEVQVEQRPVVTLVGPAADDALLGAGAPRPNGWLPTPGGLVAAIPFVGAALPRYVVIGDAATAVGSFSPSVSLDAYEATRIRVGEPAGNVDFDERTISQELGPVDDAVDFAKGCYLGQELVARIDSRGRVTRRLRQIVVSGQLSLAGAVLRASNRNVGEVSSSARFPDDDESIGLALVRHDVAEGDEVQVVLAGSTASGVVRALPNTAA